VFGVIWSGGEVDLLCSASMDSTECIPGLDIMRCTMGMMELVVGGGGWWAMEPFDGSACTGGREVGCNICCGVG